MGRPVPQDEIVPIGKPPYLISAAGHVEASLGLARRQSFFRHASCHPARSVKLPFRAALLLSCVNRDSQCCHTPYEYVAVQTLLMKCDSGEAMVLMKPRYP